MQTEYSGALIENLPYQHVIELYDRLATIQGRFVFSINDAPEIRVLFSGFRIEEASLKYTVAQKTQKPVTELIISN